jgi:hypothetical protein
MNEHLLAIRYLVNDLGDVETDDGLERLETGPGFSYELMIQLLGTHYQSEECSTISIVHGEKKLFTRELSSSECYLILETVSKIKLSLLFSASKTHTSTCPRESYNILIRRGTVNMSFAWEDDKYITDDSELLDSLMSLVFLITEMEPIDYEGFGFVIPVRL